MKQDPIEKLAENITEVEKLLKYRAKIAGNKPGRKDVEVLNKSSLVLLVACWESFIEELAEQAFVFMLKKARSHKVFPVRVLTRASQSLKEDKDNFTIWRLAGNGWKVVLKSNKKDIIKRFISDEFDSPSSKNIDNLFNDLIGQKKISQNWSWNSMSADRAREKLTNLIKLRGDIAHKVKTSTTVRKEIVTDYLDFIHKLACISNNRVLIHVKKQTTARKLPWSSYTYGRIK